MPAQWRVHCWPLIAVLSSLPATAALHLSRHGPWQGAAHDRVETRLWILRNLGPRTPEVEDISPWAAYSSSGMPTSLYSPRPGSVWKKTAVARQAQLQSISSCTLLRSQAWRAGLQAPLPMRPSARPLEVPPDGPRFPANAISSSFGSSLCPPAHARTHLRSRPPPWTRVFQAGRVLCPDCGTSINTAPRYLLSPIATCSCTPPSPPATTRA